LRADAAWKPRVHATVDKQNPRIVLEIAFRLIPTEFSEHKVKIRFLAVRVLT
jgi:hypothetical protein